MSLLVLMVVGAMAGATTWWILRSIATPTPPVAEETKRDQQVLTDFQRARLKAIFSRPEYQGQIVVILVSGDNSWEYAREIASLFDKWRVLGPFGADKNELAMDVQVSSSNLIPPPSQIPQMVLSSFQFVHLKGRGNLILDPDVPPGVTVVWVGPQSPDGVTPDNHVPQQSHLKEILAANSVALPVSATITQPFPDKPLLLLDWAENIGGSIQNTSNEPLYVLNLSMKLERPRGDYVYSLPIDTMVGPHKTISFKSTQQGGYSAPIPYPSPDWATALEALEGQYKQCLRPTYFVLDSPALAEMIKHFAKMPASFPVGDGSGTITFRRGVRSHDQHFPLKVILLKEDGCVPK